MPPNGRQMRGFDLRLLALLGKAGLSPHRIEITESARCAISMRRRKPAQG